MSSSTEESSSSMTFQDKRDGQKYEYVIIDNLKWMTSNLKHKTKQSNCTHDNTRDLCQDCGQFYRVHDALKICPEGWRLPNEKEVKTLIKLDKKGKIDLNDTLNIRLCGRMDNGKSGRVGEQNTFWIESELVNGNITHWHTFGDEHVLHNHNVVQADRQFPVRCVCELNN